MPEGLQLTYSISSADPNFAQIGTDGRVTIDNNNPGFAKITASFQGDDEYFGSSTSYTVRVDDPTGTDWVKTDLQEINPLDIFVIVDQNSKNTIATTSSSTTSAGTVTLTSDKSKLASLPEANMQWSLTEENDSITFHPNGSATKWMYVINSDDGIKIGNQTTGNKMWIYTNASYTGLAVKTGSTRYIGYYSGKWKSLKSRNNISKTSLSYYRYTGPRAYVSVNGSDGNGSYYSTYTTPSDIDFHNLNGIKAYKAKYDSKTMTIKLIAVDEAPAGTALVLKGNEGIFPLKVATTEPAALTDNDLRSESTDHKCNGTEWILIKKSDGVGFGPAKAGSILKAGKAYIIIDNSKAAKDFIGFDDSITAVKEINDGRKHAYSEAVNIVGQRVGKNYNGIIIINGKKYIRK